ncbi:MAG: hypothetical protein R2991_08280 [Thermoanaerobaculia bacterium]
MSRTTDGAFESPTAIVAPLPEETTGVLRRLEDLRRTRRGEVAGQAGLLAGRPVVVASTGDGAANAQRSLEALVRAWSPRRILVLGVAGGLTEDLEIGQVVFGERLFDAGGPAPAPDAEWGSSALAASCLPVTIFSADRLAVTPEEKSSARRGLPAGPAVVDLESSAFARVAAGSGLPFAVLRAVSDRADETLPLDFNRFMGPDGGVRRADVVRHVALRPHLLAPLMDLRRRVERCSDGLGLAAERMVAE